MTIEITDNFFSGRTEITVHQVNSLLRVRQVKIHFLVCFFCFNCANHNYDSGAFCAQDKNVIFTTLCLRVLYKTALKFVSNYYLLPLALASTETGQMSRTRVLAGYV